MRASHLGVIALVAAMSGTALAQQANLLAPLPIRDQFLLNNGFFFFEPDDASVTPGELRLTLQEAEANTFAKSAWINESLAGDSGREPAMTELADPRFRVERPLFLADGETHRFELNMRRGFANHLELGLTVPVTRIGGGWSDGLVESVHRTLGIGNDIRPSIRQNSETVYLQSGSVRYLRDRSAGYAIGDIALTGKYELTALEGKNVAMSLAGAIELPTGNARALDGSGSVDAGIQLLLSRDLGNARIHASTGFVRAGGDRVLGTRAQIVMTHTIAAARMITGGTSATIQLTLSESPFRHSGFAELTRRSNQLSLGLQRRLGRATTAYIALIENVLNYENSADAGLAWGLTTRF